MLVGNNPVAVVGWCLSDGVVVVVGAGIEDVVVVIGVCVRSGCRYH